VKPSEAAGPNGAVVEEQKMDLKRIQSLYDYNRWANSRVRMAAGRLTPDQFIRDLRNSHPSVRDTLVHVMSSEWIWLKRWQGVSPKAMLSPADFPGIAALEARWDEIESEQSKFIGGATEKSLEEMIAYVNLRGEPFAYPLWQMLYHVVNHSTYHRGQVTTMLRQLGAEPEATDLLIMVDMQSEPAVGEGARRPAR
jgi:uncharacterized damage-inducible protein DinB